MNLASNHNGKYVQFRTKSSRKLDERKKKKLRYTRQEFNLKDEFFLYCGRMNERDRETDTEFVFSSDLIFSLISKLRASKRFWHAAALNKKMAKDEHKLKQKQNIYHINWSNCIL